MSVYQLQGALLALFALQVEAAIPGRTLADCNAFASLFDNTCSSNSLSNPAKIGDFTAHAGVTMQCLGDMRCPGTDSVVNYTSDSPCEFARKLCVSCEEVDSVVNITVQSNSLPNHCFYSTVNYGVAREDEWTVTFNADMRGIENYSSDDLNTSTKTDEILCDLQRTGSTNMHESITYVESDAARMLQGGGGPPDCHPNCTGTPPDGGMGGGGMGGGGGLDTMAAIGLSGGYIFNALDG